MLLLHTDQFTKEITVKDCMKETSSHYMTYSSEMVFFVGQLQQPNIVLNTSPTKTTEKE